MAINERTGIPSGRRDFTGAEEEHIRQNGKFGYINATGETVIAPQYSRIESGGGRPFQEGLQPVWVGEKTGYVNASGQMVIRPEFSQAQAFSEGLAAVRSGEAPWKWGYIDKTGHFVIEPQFDEACVFSDGIALVMADGQAGYIGRSGAFVFPLRQRSYSPQHSTFSAGLACVEVDGRWGFINQQGSMAIAAQFGEPSSFHEGPAAVRVGKEGPPRYGFIDQSGAFAIEPRFSLACPADLSAAPWLRPWSAWEKMPGVSFCWWNTICIWTASGKARRPTGIPVRNWHSSAMQN